MFIVGAHQYTNYSVWFSPGNTGTTSKILFKILLKQRPLMRPSTKCKQIHLEMLIFQPWNEQCSHLCSKKWRFEDKAFSLMRFQSSLTFIKENLYFFMKWDWTVTNKLNNVNLSSRTKLIFYNLKPENDQDLPHNQ